MSARHIQQNLLDMPTGTTGPGIVVLVVQLLECLYHLCAMCVGVWPSTFWEGGRRTLHTYLTLDYGIEKCGRAMIYLAHASPRSTCLGGSM